MGKFLCAVLLPAVSLLACDEERASEPLEPAGCPSGQHDGGDGACVSSGCSPGYHLVGLNEPICERIVPGTITYVGVDGPVEGVTVVFHDRTGAVVAADETDPLGQVPSGLPLLDEHGYVTVVVPEEDITDDRAATLRTILTFPFDDVEIVAAPRPAAMAELRVQLPGAFADAASYVVDAGLVESGEIADPAAPVVLVLPAGELEGGAPPVIALALDAAGAPLAWSAAFDAAGADVALGAWSDVFRDQPLEISNPPAGASGFGFAAGVAGDRLYELTPRIEIAASPEGPGKPASGTLRFMEVEQLELALIVGIERSPDARGIAVDTPYYEVRDDGGLAIDLSSSVLSIPEEIDVQPGESPDRPILSWSSEPNLAHSGLTLSYASVRGEERWSLDRAPSGETALTFPELPAELADRAPADIDSARLEVTFFHDETARRPIFEHLIDPAASTGEAKGMSPRRRLTPPPDPAVQVTRARQ